MLFVQSPHPPGVVGMVGGELARYHAFTMCFTGLNVPAGTHGFGGLGYDVSYNRNDVIARALAIPTAEWVQIWDDDHVFAPDVTMRLLEHDVDVIVPVYAQRQPPFRPCLYKREMPDGSYEIHNWIDFEGQTGKVPIVSAGAGGVLVRRRVLEAIGTSDWFERIGKIGEDHVFFKKCREAGFQPYAALDVPIGHMTTDEVWPQRNAKNQWCARVDLKGKETSVAVEYWDIKYQAKA